MGSKVDNLLVKLGLAAKKARLAMDNTKEEQGGIANISKNSVANIEAGRNSHTRNLLAYLESVGILDQLANSLPDPDAISPLEREAINNKRITTNKQRPSRKHKDIDISWGDEK